MSIPVDADSIREAHRLLRAHVRRTPRLPADPGSCGEAEVTFKLELLQHGGSFKARGAFNNLLSRPVPAAGVTAASGGNCASSRRAADPHRPSLAGGPARSQVSVWEEHA